MSFYQLRDFNGSVKKNKAQEAMLNSLNGHEAFLARIAAERKVRAEGGKRDSAARKIQRVARGWRERKAQKRRLRGLFDRPDSPSLSEQMKRLAFFYEGTVDDERLMSVCALSLRQPPHSLSLPLRRWFCRRSLFPFLRSASADSFVNPCLRFLEIHIQPHEWTTFASLGFFPSLLLVFARKAAALEASEEERNLPLHLSVLVDAILHPLVNNPSSAEMMKQLATALSEVDKEENLQSAIAFLFSPSLARWLCSSPDGRLGTFLSSVPPCSSSSPPSPLLLHLLLLLLHSEDTSKMREKEQLAVVRLACDSSVLMSRQPGHPPISPSLWTLLSRRVFSAKTVAVISSLLHSPSRLSASLIPSIVVLSGYRQGVQCLSALAHSPVLLSSLWSFINSLRPSSSQSSLIDNLAISCTPSDSSDRIRLSSCLSLFCRLLAQHLLQTDDSFFSFLNWKIAFPLEQLKEVLRKIRNAALGLISLAYPDERLGESRESKEARYARCREWQTLFEDVVQALLQAEAKQRRLGFLSRDFWIDHGKQLSLTRTVFTSHRGRPRQAESVISFLIEESSDSSSEEESQDDLMDGNERALDRKRRREEKLPAEARRVAVIVRTIPFVIPFMQRVKILEELVLEDKMKHGYDEDGRHFSRRTPVVEVRARRTHLYEDAYSDLSRFNAPSLRLPVRVSLLNWAGANEAGVDGGGIFREFLSELFRQAFDVNRGLFCETSSLLLYPNPAAPQLFPDTYREHFYFLGRILGKALSEKQLCEKRFAHFFLARLLGRGGEDADISHLASLDPLLHRNLLELRGMDESQLSDLELDFSIMVNNLGVMRKIDLKPNGRSIRVTMENRQEYEQLYANFLLHENLDELVCCMREGVGNVVDIRWLTMFSAPDLEILVSGEEGEIDVEDLRRNTQYHFTGGQDESYMELLWRVLGGLADADRRQFVRFVTGCPRPPLGGFSQLHPRMGIQLLPPGHEDRLPTSATCMNLLKLPRYKDENALAERIRYAINASAGFELS